MSSPSSTLLVQRNNSNRFNFTSYKHLCQFLGISEPFNTCLAYAPHARNAPNCSYHINKFHRAKVPDVLDELLEISIPSRAAGRLLEELSSYVVCGETKRHQVKAPEVYGKWYNRLWHAYIRVNQLDPGSCDWEPPRLTRHDWESFLGDLRSEQEVDSDDEDPQDDEDSNFGESTSTPDTSSSDFIEDSPSEDIPDQHLETLKQCSARSVNLGPTLKHSISVYHDLDQVSPAPPSSSSSALRLLDPNIPTSKARNETSTASRQIGTAPDSCPLSSASLHQDSLKSTKDQPELANTHCSSEDGGLELSEEQIQPKDIQLETSVTAVAPLVSKGNEKELETIKVTEVDSCQITPHLLALSNVLNDITDDDADTEPGEDDPQISVPAPLSLPGFRLFSQVTPLQQLNQLLRTMTQTVSTKRRRAGYIYAFSRPTLPGYLKIGVTNDVVKPRRAYPDPVDYRLSVWQKNCGHLVHEVFRAHMRCAAAQRIESLIHQTLKTYRRVEDPPCDPCERRKSRRNGMQGRAGGGNHAEWFEINERKARQVVDIWRLFSEQLPYDQFGRLSDAWSERVNTDRIAAHDGDTVLKWVENMPRMVAEVRRCELQAILGSARALSQ